MTQRNNFETAEFPPRAGLSSTGQDSFANDAANSRLASRSRRGSRVPISLPVMLRDQFGGQHQARTQAVMVRGAIVTSTSNLRVGHKLTIENLKSGKTAECHIVSIEPGIASSSTLELEFSGAHPDFWPVQFPSDGPAASTTNATLTSADQLSLADDISGPPKITSQIPTPPTRSRETELVSLADSVEHNFTPPPAPKPVVQRTPPPTDSVALFRAANRAAHRHEQRMKMLYSVASVLVLAGLAFAGKNWLSHRPEPKVEPEAIAQPVKLPKIAAPSKPAPSAPSAASTTVANVFAVLKSAPSKVMAHIKLPSSTNTTPTSEVANSTPTDASIPVEAKPLTESKPVDDSQVTVRHGSSLASSQKAAQDPGEEPLALPLTASIPASAQPKSALLSAVVGTVPTQGAVLATQPQVPRALTPAKLIFTVPAQYPAIARQLRAEGEVVLNLEIDESGKVADAKVISGAPILRTAALDAVRRWKYEPATIADKPIATTQTVKVDFRLK